MKLYTGKAWVAESPEHAAPEGSFSVQAVDEPPDVTGALFPGLTGTASPARVPFANAAGANPTTALTHTSAPIAIARAAILFISSQRSFASRSGLPWFACLVGAKA